MISPAVPHLSSRWLGRLTHTDHEETGHAQTYSDPIDKIERKKLQHLNLVQKYLNDFRFRPEFELPNQQSNLISYFNS